LIVVHVITGLGDGGAESALFRLCVNNLSNNHIVISLGCSGKYSSLLRERGIEVHALNMPRGRITISGLINLWRLIYSKSPDVVQTWMYHANLLGGVVAKFAFAPKICWGIHHADLGGHGTSRSTIAVAKVCAWLSGILPSNIICCGDKSAQAHVNFGYDEARIKVVYNGYDLGVFQPNTVAGEKFRKNMGFSSREKIIGFVARFDQLKDHGNLLAALSILKSKGVTPLCLLVGAGMDSDNSYLVSLINSFDLFGQVKLLGRRDDIPDVMNALDLHVMSSRSEAFPNVLAESMACGTPCVTTNIKDATEIVRDTGWVAPAQDASALAEAILTALISIDDASGWVARKDSSRKRIEDLYSINRMVDSYVSCWKS